MAVSLRVPAQVKKRIANLARRRKTTRAAFHAEALRRLQRMKKTAAGIPAAEVFEYLEQRANGKQAVRPKARRAA